MIKLILSTILLFGIFQLNQLDIVENISLQADEIEMKLSSFERIIDNDIEIQKDLNPEKYSYESLELKSIAIVNMKRFMENGKVRKATITFDCEQTDLSSSYYYRNDSIIFVSKKRIDYQDSKWSENFDKNNREIRTEKLYFSNDKLIEWTSDNEKLIEFNNAEIGRKILNDAYLYKCYN